MGGHRIRAFRRKPRFVGRRVAKKLKKAVKEKSEPLSSNEALMLRMIASGVKPDPDHTEASHNE
jgi:hypothetical protein